MKISMSNWALLLLAVSAVPTAGQAADLYVIANNASTISGADVREFFLAEKQNPGTQIVPFDNASAQKEFLDKIMKMDSAKYKEFWSKKVFRDGVNPPSTKSNDADVIAAVKASAGGLGYVSSPPSGVRIVSSLVSPSLDVKSCEAPKYPKASLLNEETGTVELEFVVSADGKIAEPKVVKSSGSKSLDKATVSAYSLCKFSPGKKDGKAEESRLTVSYTWKLE